METGNLVVTMTQSITIAFEVDLMFKPEQRGKAEIHINMQSDIFVAESRRMWCTNGSMNGDVI